MEQKISALDKLRMRRGLFDLICSCLTSGNEDMAEQLFQCSVLEHVYDRLGESHNATCCFATSEMLRRFENANQLMLDISEHPRAVEDFIPIIRVQLEGRARQVYDTLQEAIFGIIVSVTNDVIRQSEHYLSRQRKRKGNGPITFYIVPTQCSIGLKTGSYSSDISCPGYIGLCIDVEKRESDQGDPQCEVTPTPLIREDGTLASSEEIAYADRFLLIAKSNGREWSLNEAFFRWQELYSICNILCEHHASFKIPEADEDLWSLWLRYEDLIEARS